MLETIPKWDCAARDTIRGADLHNLQLPRKPIHSIVGLYGPQAKDIKILMQRGEMNPMTRVFGAERVSDLRRSMEFSLKQLGVRRMQIKELLHQVVLSGTQIDFAHIDMCCCMNGKTARWMHKELSRSLRERSLFHLSIMRNRYTRFQLAFWKIIKDEDLRQMEERVKDQVKFVEPDTNMLQRLILMQACTPGKELIFERVVPYWFSLGTSMLSIRARVGSNVSVLRAGLQEDAKNLISRSNSDE